MAENSYSAKTYQDFLSSFESGMNSGVAPQILSKNQLAFALNTSLRGGFARTRPPFHKKTLNFNGNSALQSIVLNGLFQGAGYYRPDFGTESLIAQFSGHLVQFTENGTSWTVTDISVPGDLNSASVTQVWMWQSEKWMIVQDGTATLPIFFDGTISRRSYGPSVVLAVTAANFTTPTPAVIGNTISLTLTAPYTGPYNVPVIFDGEFYQPTNSTSLQVILTNLNDTPGDAIAAGTPIVFDPSFVGLTTGFTYGQNGIVSGATAVYINFSTAPNAVVGDVLTIPNFSFTYTVLTATGLLLFADSVAAGGFFDLGGVIAGTGVGTFAPTSSVIKKQTASPSVVIANLTNGFSAPPVGGSITVLLSAPYTGANNITVSINGNYYNLSTVPISGTGTTLTMVNLTDGNAGKLIAAGAKILSVPELPAGRMGAYGMGCNALCLTDGLSYVIGDVVGSGAGTPANNYRDAVLKMTQNTFLAGGGNFRLPGSGDIINAVIFPPQLDTSLGQGPLQIGTAFSIFSNYVIGTFPGNWAALTSPIQTESLKDKGPLAQNSTVIVNSDTFFRSAEGIGSLVLARRDFVANSWGNKPVSNELQRILNPDNPTLLSYGSGMTFDNRYFSSLSPQVSARGVFHMGLGTLNFDLLSSLRTTLPASWEGAWTGLNALQVVSGRVNGSKRSFAFTFNIDSNIIELYELLPENTTSYADNDVTPITWVFETPVIFNKDIKPMNELVQLRDGEVYLSDIQGDVKVKVLYRPDYYPCWTTWREFEVCQSSDANNSKPGYRTRIGLGEPDVTPCERGNNRPLREGYFFQLRFEVTGSCIFKGLRASALSKPQTVFAPVECDVADCQVIDCDIPDDFRIYSLQGLPPAPLPPVTSPPLTNSNQVVYFNAGCGPTTPLVYHGTLPTWITLDQANSRLVGAANTFWGGSQDAANAAAQTAINAFANAALLAGTLVCFTCGSVPQDVASLTWTRTHTGGSHSDLTAAGPNIDIVVSFNPSNEVTTQTGYICNSTANFKTLRATCTPNNGQQGNIRLTLNGTPIYNTGFGFPDVHPPPDGHTTEFFDFQIPPYSLFQIALILTCDGNPCALLGNNFILSLF